MYKNLFLLTTLTGLLLAGCTSYDCCDQSVISVNPPTIVIPFNGGTHSIDVTSPIPWIVTGMDPSWMSLDRETFGGSTTINVIVPDPNVGLVDLTCTLTFLAANGDTFKVTVTQKRFIPAPPETIVYDGTDPSVLGPDLWGDADCLFPSLTATDGNTVTVTGGVFGMIYGAQTNVPGVAVTNNTVIIDGASVNIYAVFGGYSLNGDATDNTVAFKDGTAYFVFGGRSQYGDAINNKVTMSGGTVGIVTGGCSSLGDAKGNEVSISDGTVSDVIRGGESMSFGGDATNNTVTILGGSPTLNLSGATIIGGNGIGDCWTGNTLTIKVASTTGTPLVVYDIENFEFLNFSVPGDITTGYTMVTASSYAVITNSKIGIDFYGAAPTLAVGDVIVLISAGTLYSGTFTPQTVTVGAYTFSVYVSGNQLVAEVI